jgi:hypothetical protein
MGFNFIPSSSPRTKREQEERFKRHCNRVFKIRKSDKPQDLTTQYNKKHILPDAQDYNYLVPFFSSKL